MSVRDVRAQRRSADTRFNEAQNVAASPNTGCIDEPRVVERRRGKNVAIAAGEDHSSLGETAYLLSSPENARRLLQALRRRRIDREHRLGYRVEGDLLIVLAGRFHC